ncbi:MAG: L,D-transpeptidase family protein [Alphaproteobacteria bacterium]|nr:L,D-transpeptidase family protein [Alphaproteobacteria bacterium]
MSHLTVAADGVLVLPGRPAISCALGRSGVVPWAEKAEGDGATPAGLWPLRHVFYRPDRMEAPETRLPVAALTPDLGWSDDPSDPVRYNAPVRLPYPHSHEVLWRDDHLYDVIVVMGINDGPPQPGKGSALFFHLAREGYGPTEGCVAVARSDMLSILKDCGPESVMEIGE